MEEDYTAGVQELGHAMESSEIDCTKPGPTESCSHYEMKTHENPVNIFMVYSQDFHMFFMAFSWIISPGFSWVEYHEKSIKMP